MDQLTILKCEYCKQFYDSGNLPVITSCCGRTVCRKHLEQVQPNPWKCVFCNEECDTSRKILINHTIKKLLDNIDQSKDLLKRFESESNKSELLKTETRAFVTSHFKEILEKANRSKKQELEEIEKKYNIFFETVNKFKTRIERQIELESSKEFLIKNLQDSIKNNDHLLNEDKWKSTEKEANQIILELKTSNEAFQSFKAQVSEFILNTVDLNNNFYHSEKDTNTIDLNNNLHLNFDDSIQPNLEASRPSQLLGILDHLDFPNEIPTDDKTNEDTDASSVFSEKKKNDYLSRTKKLYSDSVLMDKEEIPNAQLTPQSRISSDEQHTENDDDENDDEPLNFTTKSVPIKRKLHKPDSSNKKQKLSNKKITKKSPEKPKLNDYQFVESDEYKLLTTIKGHKSTIRYSVLDRTHSLLITGSEDRTIKIWSLKTGFLVGSFRTDLVDIKVLDVDYENNILGVAAERQILIWDLRNGQLKDILSYPIHHHTKPICCLKFSPMCKDDNIRYLVSGAEDGNVNIKMRREYRMKNTAKSSPLKFNEASSTKAKIKELIFSAGGYLLAALVSDGSICIYDMAKETKVYELEAKYSNKLNRENLLGSNFASNSLNGIRLLTFCATSDPFIVKLRKNNWEAGNIPLNKLYLRSEKSSNARKLSLETQLAAWCCHDTYIVYIEKEKYKNSILKVYKVNTQNDMTLLDVQEFNFKAVFMKPHPSNPNIIAIATATNQIYILDIIKKEILSNTTHSLELTSLNWSCNTTIPVCLTITFSDGSFGLYGNEKEIRYFNKVPREQFFSTDHISVRIQFDDKTNTFIDEETGKPPHLIPKGDLTKMDRTIVLTCNQLESEVFNDDDVSDNDCSRKLHLIPHTSYQIIENYLVRHEKFVRERECFLIETNSASPNASQNQNWKPKPTLETKTEEEKLKPSRARKSDEKNVPLRLLIQDCLLSKNTFI